MQAYIWGRARADAEEQLTLDDLASDPNFLLLQLYSTETSSWPLSPDIATADVPTLLPLCSRPQIMVPGWFCTDLKK